MQATSQAGPSTLTIPCIDQTSSYITMHPITKPLEHFPKKTVRTLGLLQLICGCLCIIFNSVGIAVEAHLALLSHSIWCGALFATTGVFGMLAGQTKMSFHIVTFMVLSIISASLCPYVLVFAAVGLDEDAIYCRHKVDGEWVTCSKSLHITIIAMNVMLIVMSVAEATFAIISAAICSRAYCCYSSPTIAPRQGIQIIYVDASSNMGASVLNPEYNRPETSLPDGVTNCSKDKESVEPPSYDKYVEDLQSSVTPL